MNLETMCGKNKGEVENYDGTKPLGVQCIIYQKSLCGKCLKMSEIVKLLISSDPLASYRITK